MASSDSGEHPGADVASGPVREVPVDWEALEDAFENNAPEVHSYLHLATGEVLRVVDGVADPQMHVRIASDANYLRYLAAGFDQLALLSTGTFIIGFESQTDILRLDPQRETFSFTNVFGQPIGCCGFFGGGEFDKLLAGASPSAASAMDVETIIAHSVFALPSFSDTGGPVAGSGNRGRIEGPFSGALAQRASLATLYTALMTSEALDAVESRSPIVIDGPFARNDLFCSLLAALRPRQRVASSLLQEGTAAGAAVLALMNAAGDLPEFAVELKPHEPGAFAGLRAYQSQWQAKARAAAR